MKSKKFSAYRIIDYKKKGIELSKAQMSWFIQGALDGSIPKYQVTAFLMACYVKPLNIEETFTLTKIMMNSGSTLKFKGKHFVDKHSTGGIGDKASFILGPIAASCGIKVPMIAGRALGHTGGTIDKVESIRGFKTNVTLEKFAKLVKSQDFSLIGQTKEIAPADGLLYGLRDVSATVDNIQLITASILSKKLAEGANGIVMDIKTGSGAFMENAKDAKALADSIIGVLTRMKRNSAALITDMSQPLGQYVGNANEIIESIETLSGRGPKDLTTLSVELAAYMVLVGGKAKNINQAREKAMDALTSGKALAKFREVIKSQGGSLKALDSLGEKLAKSSTVLKASKDGYVESFKNKEIGLQLIELGGGRKVFTDKIDHFVGFKFHKKVGDAVKKGEPLLTITHHDHQSTLAKKMRTKFNKEIITLSSKKVKAPKLIKKVIV